MPINIDEFEAADKEDLKGDLEQSKDDKVLEYLAFNPGKAYSREEIQSATGITGLDLISVLSRLENQNLVRHKGSYWAIEEEQVDAEPTRTEQL